MRIFLAINTNEKVKSSISEIINKLKKSGANVKWVDPQKAHLTLKFFGETDNQTIEQIKLNTKNALGKFNNFNIQVKNLGSFPFNRNYIKVVWAGVEKTKSIQNLYDELNKIFNKIGFPPDHKNFIPHITLGRVKKGGNKSLIKTVNEFRDYFFGNVLVDELVLYSSKLSPKGPEYTAIEKFKLE